MSSVQTRRRARLLSENLSKTNERKKLNSKKEASLSDQQVDIKHDEILSPVQPTKKCSPGYLSDRQIRAGITALKKYTKKSEEKQIKQRKNLLEAGEADSNGYSSVLIDIVFKQIPANSRTYIHTVVLPHHWRLKLEPEDYNIALFVRHRKPENEVLKIQFARDRDLDLENTHSYYEKLFSEKLDESIRSRISRIITSKELPTEYGTFQKLDRLAKTYDLFLSDRQLMENKLNPLPRRLGRRFWVREKKVPLMVRLNARNLNERFQKVLSTEPFYVSGHGATEKIKLGLINQPDQHIVANIKTFLRKLYDLYGDDVRFIRLRSDCGIALPLYADLSSTCSKVVMKKERIKLKPVIDDFDFVEGVNQVSVYPDGTVQLLRQKRKRKDEESPQKHILRNAKRAKSS